MPPTPTPTPSTTSPAHAVLHGLWIGVSDMASQHPWLVVVAALALLTAIGRSLRIAIHSGPRDAVRRFSRSDKFTLLARAGHRCEHHDLFGSRCRRSERLEADHIHPWSRGGWTHPSNGQILCQSHNRDKRADIPWDRTLRKIAERRVGYYPTGTVTPILRREPRKARPARAV